MRQTCKDHREQFAAINSYSLPSSFTEDRSRLKSDLLLQKTGGDHRLFVAGQRTRRTKSLLCTTILHATWNPTTSYVVADHDGR